MSNVYTYSDARQNLATLLEKALKEGQVRVRRKDGQEFVIEPVRKSGSPFDVESVDLGLTTTEIIEFIHEGRRV
jgi:hypothetical protein